MSAGRLSKGVGRRIVDAVLWAWFGLALVFLFSPIVTSIVYSFNVGVDGKQSADFTGWTGSWYGAAFADGSLRDATATSLVVAFWSALIAVVVGSALGFALVRNPSRAVRRLLSTLTYVLLIVPETVIGVSLLLFYTETKIPLGLLTLIAGHTPLSISVVAFIVRARLLTLDSHLEEASADLGAGRWKSIRFIVVPQLLPAIGAAALLAYTFSFDNVVVSNFLSTASVSTLPVYLYGSLQYGPSPAVYATTTVILVASLAVLAVAAVLLRTVLRQWTRNDDALAAGAR
jgi:ABC-type spermidine/putrescine transport system permease subunit II